MRISVDAGVNADALMASPQPYYSTKRSLIQADQSAQFNVSSGPIEVVDNISKGSSTHHNGNRPKT